MNWFFTPWMIPGLIGTTVAGTSAWVAWRHRPNAGATALAVLSLAVAWWCLMQVVGISADTLQGKVRAAQLQYLGIATVPLAWFWFAVSYTSQRERVTPAGWLLLALPEVATLFLAWTNQWHGLIWKRLELLSTAPFALLSIDHGVWFRLNTLYAYALVILGTSILVFSLSEAPHNRKKAVSVIAAALCPVVANLVYLLGLTSARLIDLTPSGFALGGLVLTWSLLRDDLLDLPPIAWKKVLDAMHDGVLVLNARGRVLDLNPAAARLLGCAVGDTLGEPLFDRRSADVAAATAGGAEMRQVVDIAGRALEISRSATEDAGRGGTIVVVRDVTERDRLQREIQGAGDRLIRANEELTRLASTDDLTGLPNRRHFLSVLEQEIRRATRFQHPVGVLLLDIDNFKRINDSLGHAAGDLVLRGVSEAIRRILREVDTVGRLGGDELAIVLPETDVDGSRTTAERILQKIPESVFHPFGQTEVSVTVSIGLAVAGPGSISVEELLHRADLALYAAKAAGRNQVYAAPSSESGVRLPD